VLEDAAFSIETTGSRVVVRGELDLATAPQLDQALGALSGDVTVDCRDLTFVDSSALGVLLRAHHRLAEHQHRLVIEGLSARCRRVFEVSGLDETLHLA
jgi:anti-sigma B factor antagonist